MNKEIFDKVEMIKGIVRIIIPNVCKKKYIESTESILSVHLDELSDMIKDVYCGE